jgi:hypothetical protein
MQKGVLNFLQNPLETGAYCARLFIPQDTILGLWEFLAEKSKQNHKRFRIAKPDFNREYVEFSREFGAQDSLDKTLDDMLTFLVEHLKEFSPEAVNKWSNYGNSIIAPEYFRPSNTEEGGYFFFAPQTYFADVQDAISIIVDGKAFPDFVAEVVSLTPKAITEFKAFIQSIPFRDSNVRLINEGKRHSKRLLYNLYPAVAGLWAYEFAYADMNREILDLVGAALEYMDKREWQMSVILSAFAVEGILVDIYEELLRKEAPPAPIGFLVQEINKKKNFPPDALRPLKIVNRTRKAAVHRGIKSITQRDSIVALIGTVQFCLWFCFNGKEFCGIASEK